MRSPLWPGSGLRWLAVATPRKSTSVMTGESDAATTECGVLRHAPTRSLRRRDGLIQFAEDVTSQGGEDGIIAAIFQTLDATQRGAARTRWCVDVGAWDGVHLSNTHSLLTGAGSNWRGALVEADGERFAKLKALHEPLGNFAIEALVSCCDASRTVESLLKKHAKSVPLCCDLVSIDVDGCDYWIWRDLLESPYASRVYVVEFNPTIPHDVVYVQPRSDATRHGSSLAALVDLGKKFGYTLAETTTYNAFFVDDKARLALEKAGFLRADDDIDSLHEVTMGTRLFQLYDGTLKLDGCKKFLWHRVPIDEAKLQQIAIRDFPFKPNGAPNGAAGPKHGDAAKKQKNGSKKRHRNGARANKHRKKEAESAAPLLKLGGVAAATAALAAALLLRLRAAAK